MKLTGGIDDMDGLSWRPDVMGRVARVSFRGDGISPFIVIVACSTQMTKTRHTFMVMYDGFQDRLLIISCIIALRNRSTQTCSGGNECAGESPKLVLSAYEHFL